jgi:hypothetical protein
MDSIRLDYPSCVLALGLALNSIADASVPTPCQYDDQIPNLDCGSQQGTGNFDYSVSLTPYDLIVNYNSRQKPLLWRTGHKFSLAIEAVYAPAESPRMIYFGDGSQIPLKAKGSGFVPADERVAQFSIESLGNGHRMLTQDGTELSFSPCSPSVAESSTFYWLSEIKERNGRSVQITRSAQDQCRITKIVRDGLTTTTTNIGYSYLAGDQRRTDPATMTVTGLPNATVRLSFETFTSTSGSVLRTLLRKIELPNVNGVKREWVFQYVQQFGTSLLALIKRPDAQTIAIEYAEGATGEPGIVASVREDGFQTVFTYTQQKVQTQEGDNKIVEDFSSGRLIRTEINGIRTDLQRDASGRVTRISNHIGQNSDFTYVDASSRLLKSIASPVHQTTFDYDYAGPFPRLKKKTVKNLASSAAGSTVITNYFWATDFDLDYIDVNGWVRYDFNFSPTTGNLGGLFVCDGGGSNCTSDFSNAAYGPKGELLSYQNSLGEVISYSYSSDGSQVVTSLPDGRTIRANYNALGLPVFVGTDGGSSVAYGYDPIGRLLSISSESNGAFPSNELKISRVESQDGRTQSVEMRHLNDQRWIRSNETEFGPIISQGPSRMTEKFIGSSVDRLDSARGGNRPLFQDQTLPSAPR